MAKEKELRKGYIDIALEAPLYYPITLAEVLKDFPKVLKAGTKELEKSWKKEGVLSKILAGLETVFFPITLTGKVVGELPVRRALKKAGASPAYAKTMGKIAGIGVEFLTPFGVEKALAKAREAPKVLKHGIREYRELKRAEELEKEARWASFLQEQKALMKKGKLQTKLEKGIKEIEKGVKEGKFSPEQALEEIKALRERLLKEHLPEEVYEKYMKIKPIVEEKIKKISMIAPIKGEIISQEMKKARKAIAKILNDPTYELTIDDAIRLLGFQKIGVERHRALWTAFVEKFPEIGQYLLTPDEIEIMFQVVRHAGFDFTTQMNAISAFRTMLMGELPHQPSRIRALEAILGDEAVNALKEYAKRLKTLKKTKAGRPMVDLNEVLYATRALYASADMSALLRQAMPFVGRKTYWQNIGNYVKAFLSEEKYNRILHEIATDPLFPLADKLGLGLAELGTMAKAEELFMSRVAEKIFWIRWSERGYVAFLNKLRFDVFKDWTKKLITLGYHPNTHEDVFRKVVEYINIATGRGEFKIFEALLGRREKVFIEQASKYIFFAPRLMMSRIEYPAFFIRDIYKLPYELRVEAWRDLGVAVNMGLTVLGIAKLFGGDEVNIETNPTSADYLKINYKGLRIDPWGGFQQEIVLLTRLLTGEMVSSITGRKFELGDEYGIPSKWDILVKFIQNKMHPLAKATVDYLSQRGYTETLDEVSISDVLKAVSPFIVQDIFEAYERGVEVIPIAGLAGFVGMGVQAYGINDHIKKTVRNLGIDKEIVNTVNDELEKLGISIKKDFNIVIGAQEGRIVIDRKDLAKAYKGLYLKLIYPYLYSIFKTKEYQELPIADKIRAIRRANDEVARVSKLYLFGFDTKYISQMGRLIRDYQYNVYKNLGYDEKTARMKAERETEEILTKLIEENEKLLEKAKTINKYFYKD